MPAHRFYLADPLTNACIILKKEELHHLKNVMRAQVGDIIEIVNGKGCLAQGRVTSIENKSATCEIVHKTHPPSPLPLIILAQALTRPALLDWIIEKGTELGASQFWLFPGELSEKKELTPHQMERLLTLTISAMKQCGRLDLPTLHIKPSLLAWPASARTLLYGSLASSASPLQGSYPSPVIMVIGPEKGFSKKEESWLKEHGTGITLHPHTLRAETAAICALSLLSQQLTY